MTTPEKDLRYLRGLKAAQEAFWARNLVPLKILTKEA